MPTFQYIKELNSKHAEIEKPVDGGTQPVPPPLRPSVDGARLGREPCMYTVSQLGEGELDIAAGTLTVKGESAKTRLLLTVRAEAVFVHSGTFMRKVKM